MRTSFPQSGQWSQIWLPAIITLLLSACASPSGPATVSVPIAASCVPAQVPDIPRSTTNEELLQLDDRSLVLTIASERLELIAWSKQIAPILEACR
jgi:hypothetical protein